MSLLGLTLAINLLGGFRNLATRSTSADGAGKIDGPEVGQWQAWLETNSMLFEPLATGARIGIAPSWDSSVGVIITKTAPGLIASGTRRMKQDHPGIIIVLKSDMAGSLTAQTSSPMSLYYLTTWIRLGRIQAYYMKERDTLKKDGYLEFLDSIGMSTN